MSCIFLYKLNIQLASLLLSRFHNWQGLVGVPGGRNCYNKQLKRKRCSGSVIGGGSAVAWGMIRGAWNRQSREEPVVLINF